MPANALVQTRIDADVKQRAAEVLSQSGMTLSDAVRILLTRTAREGALPFEIAVDTAAHDAWFRQQVRKALDDSRSPIPAETVHDRFQARRAAAARKAR